MHHRCSSRSFLVLAVLLVALLLPAIGQTPDAKAKDKLGKHQIRLVCVTSLEENQKVVLASRDADGKWQEHATLELRNPLISDWFPVRSGELHLAVSRNGALESICRFTCTEDTSHGLVLLVANAETKTFDAHFVDPKKEKFEKGSLFIINLSPQAGKVSIGGAGYLVEAGKRALVKPAPNESGMLEMKVSHLNERGEDQVCYDRAVSSDLNTYGMLILLPDKETVLNPIRLSMFGELK